MERAVQIAYNRILGYFHGEQFYNLDELNEAIAERLADINDAHDPPGRVHPPTALQLR